MRFLIAVLALALGVLPDFAAAQSFVPHRALYDMKLHGTAHNPAIQGVGGEMLAEWNESCEGWTFEHRAAFDVGTGGGGTMRIATQIATWESRDGLSYRFSVRNVGRAGGEARIEGVAQLDGKGKGGSVRYTQPKAKTMPLPPGTIFPNAHSDEMLARAAEAPVSFKRIVFDGLSGDGLFEVNAFVGPLQKPRAAERPAAQPVAGLKSWPTQVAFFRNASADATPVNEMSFRMYANGVSDDMVIEFGEFRVLAVLKALELAHRPDCK